MARCGEKHRSTMAPPRDYVVHDTSPRPPAARRDLARCGPSPAPLSKGHGSTPSLQFLIDVGHRQQAVFLFPRPLLSIIRFSQSPRTRPLLAAYAFAISLHTVAFGSVRSYIAFPHTAAFGIFVVFSHSPLQASRTRSLVTAFPFSQSSRTPLRRILAHDRLWQLSPFHSLLAHGRFWQHLPFRSLLAQGCFWQRPLLPSPRSPPAHSRSWQLSLCAAFPHDRSSVALALRRRPAHGRLDSSRSSQSSYTRSLSTAFALRNPPAHGRFWQHSLFAVFPRTGASAAFAFSPAFLQSPCTQLLVAAFAFRSLLAHSRFLAAFAFVIASHGCP